MPRVVFVQQYVVSNMTGGTVVSPKIYTAEGGNVAHQSISEKRRSNGGAGRRIKSKTVYFGPVNARCMTL